MSLQFNCPFCQLLMSAESSIAGGQVQCPSCHQVFMIGSTVAAVPVVTARSVPQPQARQAPSAPKTAAPSSKPPAPGSHRPGAKPPLARPPAPAKPASKPKADDSETKAKIMIGLVLLAGVGLVYGGFQVLSMVQAKAKKDAFALPESVVKRDQEKKEALRKQQAEEAAEDAKDKMESRAYLRTHLCEGNDKVAGELLAVLDSIRDEVTRLAADADSNNDAKDLQKFYTDELVRRSAANSVIRNWLGGRSAKTIAEALWGGDPDDRRGQTPAFLMAANYSGNGTGFYISSDGWLLTNQHVVGDLDEVDVRGEDGKIITAKVVSRDEKADIALLKADARPAAWLPLSFGELQMGGNVFTIGYPNMDIQGVEPKFTDGRISSLTGYRDDRDSYQTTVPVQPGNSGGPLVDLKTGAAVGIVFSILGREMAENVSYAIKGKVVESFLKRSPAASVAASASQAGSPALATEGDRIARVKSATVLVLVRQ